MALLLALLIWGLALMTGYMMVDEKFAAPEALSEAARSVDSQIALTMVITGVAFLAAEFLLGYVIFRYRDRGQARAQYIHGNSLVEYGGMLVTGVVFVFLAISGQKVYAELHLTPSPPDAIRIEVTGEQFVWNIRYPGPDGKFGETHPRYYEKVGNTVGIIPGDPDGADDIITINQLAVPVNRAVELTLRSKDVLHSFFLPNLRIKQDSVPGLAIPLRFTADRTGNFEIVCAELCGLTHYRMFAFLKVLEPAEYQAWLEEMAEE